MPKTAKEVPLENGAVAFKKETLYGMVDDVERLNFEGLMVVMRAKSSGTAKQIIDLVDLSGAPRVERSFKTKIGRGVTTFKLVEGGSVIVGGHHGYSVVNLESGKAQALALDESTQTAAFTLHEGRVLFAQLAVNSPIASGFYSHALGAKPGAIEKIGELPKRTTKPSRNWGESRDASRVTPRALFHFGSEIVLVTDEGFICFDPTFHETRRVELEVNDFFEPELFDSTHFMLSIDGSFSLVDIKSGKTTELFDDDGAVCRDGEFVYSCAAEEKELRVVQIARGKVTDVPRISYSFAKDKKEEEYPFDEFWVTGRRGVIMNHLKSGFVFDLP